MTAALLACIISGVALALPIIRTLRQFEGLLRPAAVGRKPNGSK